MLPARVFPGEHVAGEIELMQALHNNDLDAGSGIIDAAAKRGVKTQVDRFPLKLADGLLRIEGIVKDQYVTAEAGSGGLHAGGEHGAALRVFIMAFEVLIFGKRKHLAPVALVPRRLNDAAAENTVLRAQLLRVRDEHEAARGIRCPYPDGEKHGDQKALHGAWRHVEDDAFQSLAAGLEVALFDQGEIVTDEIKMPVPLEFADRFQYLPCIFHECPEVRLIDIIRLFCGRRRCGRVGGFDLRRSIEQQGLALWRLCVAFSG